jgi:prepilin-type N-terminal cleavage/methylation domain-containing protein/prepilin-type processing-associated H-X9-DG protein
MARQSRAFTLIELLVVISIIALLMAIMMPALSKAKESGREIVCKSHLTSIGLGWTMFLGDNDMKPADNRTSNGFFWYDSNHNIRPVSDNDAYWGVSYLSYVKEPKVFGCPSYRAVAELIYPDEPKLIFQAAFSLSQWVYWDLDTNKERGTLAQIRHPDSFVVCHDHVEPKVEQGAIDMFHNNGPGTMNLTHYRAGGARARFYRGIFRHNIRSNDAFKTDGRANILWMDGHVTTLQETTGDDFPKWWYSGKCPHNH